MMNLLDLYTHTTTNGHTYSSLYETAGSASEHGVHVFSCSDHTPAIPSTCHHYRFINFKVIPRTLYGMKLMMGTELNIMDCEGRVDLEQDLLQDLSYAIASLRYPYIRSGTMTQNTNAYLGAMKNPAIHIIGHSDDSRCPVDHGTLVSAAREHETLLEANSSSLSPMSSCQGARENHLKMLELCRYYKIPTIVGSDTHYEVDSGNHTFAHVLLKEVSFSPELVVNTPLDLLADYIPRFTSTLTQPDDARCDRAGRDAGSTTSTDDTTSAGNTVPAGDTGK